MQPAAQAEQQRQTLIEGRHLLARQLAEDVPDSALVDRSQMVNQRERLFGEAARSGCERRIQQPLTGRAQDVAAGATHPGENLRPRHPRGNLQSVDNFMYPITLPLGKARDMLEEPHGPQFPEPVRIPDGALFPK